MRSCQGPQGEGTNEGGSVGGVDGLNGGSVGEAKDCQGEVMMRVSSW